jgi:hypothetical protein
MNQKIRRPKVKLPGKYKDVAMLSAINNGGKVERTYIKLMCESVHSYEKRKNENLRKTNRDSDE